MGMAYGGAMATRPRGDAPFQQRPYERYATDVGTRLAKAREKAHLPVAEAARRAGISRGTLTVIEQGQMRGDGKPANPQLGIIYALCGVYQVDIGDLLPPR